MDMFGKVGLVEIPILQSKGQLMGSGIGQTPPKTIHGFLQDFLNCWGMKMAR